MAETSPNSAGHQSSSVVTLTLTPAFKLVFVSALCITLLSVIVCCPLAVLGASTNGSKGAFRSVPHDVQAGIRRNHRLAWRQSTLGCGVNPQAETLVKAH